MQFAIYPARYLSHDIVDDAAVNIGQAKITPLESIRQFFMVDAKLMKQCRMEIVNVDRRLGDIV